VALGGTLENTQCAIDTLNDTGVDFFADASLVMIPEGYGTGVVYGQRPLTSDSQLTFTRASTATRVGPDGAIAVVGSNVPRIDYTGGGCGKLLLEPQRTNLVTFSEQMDNAAWTKASLSVTANQTTSPSGYDDADLIDALTGTGQHIISAATITYTNAVPYTFSVFAKKGNTSLIQLSGASVVFGSNVWATYNFDTLEVTAGSAATASMVDYGSGWYRLILTGTVTGAATVASFYAAFTNDKSVRLPSFTAANQTVYLWGAQTEQASYATSYIPTTAAAVTRLAEECSKTGISSLIGQTQGTLFAEFKYEGVTITPNGDRIISVSDGTSNNRISLFKNLTLGTIYFFVGSGGSTIINEANISGTSIIGGTHKIAVAYKSGDYAVFFDGVLVFSSNAAVVPATTAVFVGSDETGSVKPLSGGINQALIFKTRLSNEQLQKLTSL
jgi:hypothetical protein